MKIIKDKQIIDDHWTHLADDEAITSGDIIVSLSYWKKEQAQLSQYQDKLGIRLEPADAIEEIIDTLDTINLIALNFPAFADGRGFSQTRLLRDQYDFKGEIRAIGGYMLDQVCYLYRVGVNSFELENNLNAHALEVALSSLNDFTVQYQRSTC